ncbi:uncharacterized protein LOC127188407 [Acomys russatus]|uniref:uncharacterized protein LOC127188407 n=1 Tax=Acomys russatus TaxID=60746 RepID=UPI0021E2C894|nr:uncharacterized protein LOC127188407 [Acomys russatus]
MTSSPEASIRLIKFSAAALAAEARGAGDLGERQSLGAGAQRRRERSPDPPAEPKTSVSPSFSSPLAGPLPHCYAGRVGPEKFPCRSPNFLLPAKARVGGRRSASRSSAELRAGAWLCTSASAAGALGYQLGCWSPCKPWLSAAASPKARGQRERTKRLRRAPGRGEQPPAMLLSSQGRPSAQRAPNQPTLCAASRQPALRLCARSSGAQNCPRHSSAKGSSRPGPAEPTRWAPQPRARGYKKPGAGASREGKPLGRGGRVRSPRELRASLSQGLPASIQPPGPSPSVSLKGGARTWKQTLGLSRLFTTLSCESWGVPCPVDSHLRLLAEDFN